MNRDFNRLSILKRVADWQPIYPVTLSISIAMFTAFLLFFGNIGSGSVWPPTYCSDAIGIPHPVRLSLRIARYTSTFGKH
jgi:hypothetical protein